MKMIAYVMYIGRDTKKENMVNDVILYVIVRNILNLKSFY